MISEGNDCDYRPTPFSSFDINIDINIGINIGKILVSSLLDKIDIFTCVEIYEPMIIEIAGKMYNNSKCRLVAIGSL